MSRLLQGSLLLLFVVIVNILTAFITTGETDGFSDCNEDGECEDFSEVDFLVEIADVTYTGIDGAPIIVNVLYVSIMAILFTVGILLIVVSFVPTTSA